MKRSGVLARWPRLRRPSLQHRAGRVGLGLVALSSLVVSSAAWSASSAPPAPDPSIGVTLDKVPPNVPLIDAKGQATNLAAFRGKVVVLAPFLTLCQETCPITTGALIEMRQAVMRAGLGHDVAIVEVTVDPERDTPARLRAYSRTFGVPFNLLTGTTANLARLWHSFGVFYQKVKEDSPPEIDWWTHKPLTYDIDHEDGFIILDKAGHERFITVDMPDLHDKLTPKLKALLDQQGLNNLAHPQAGWTVPQALTALSWVVGKKIT